MLRRELFNSPPLNQLFQEEIRSYELLKQKSSSFEIQVRNILTVIEDIIIVVNICGNKLQNLQFLPTKIQTNDKNINVIDKMIEVFWQEDKSNMWLSKIQQALSIKQTLNFDYTLLLESDEIWFSASISPISENSVIWVARDISERVLIEQALKKSEHHLREKTIQLEQLLEKVQNLANLDGLTQIANRYCFNNYINQKWSSVVSSQAPIAFMLIDVDYFKLYNDAYGHLAGDACLVKVANAIKSVVKRQSDLVARYGGEEFSITLLNTDERGAVQVAQLIIEQIKQLSIPHALSQVADMITVSVGIAVGLPSIYSSAQDLIDKADKALYKAKKEGRNRCCCASPN